MPGYVLATPPAVEPISTAEAKAHLRVDTSDDDSLIDGLVIAARETAENILNRALITQTWQLVLDAFPSGSRVLSRFPPTTVVQPYTAMSPWYLSGGFKVPFPPLQSVSSITYIDQEGSPGTVTSSDYIVDTAHEPGRVFLKYGASWPSVTLQPAAGVTIEYVAGYGDAAADVPQAIKQAMFLIMGHLYENRESVVVGTIAKEIPLGAMSLLWNYRIF